MLNQFGFDPKAAGMDFATLNHDTLAETMLEKMKARYEEKETFSARRRSAGSNATSFWTWWTLSGKTIFLHSIT